MTGPVAQIVALTCYGNAVLQREKIPAFSPGNSSCSFCERILFIKITKPFFGKQKEVEIAGTPDDWFLFLKKNGVSGIRLIFRGGNDPEISDRMSAAFVGGGGSWLMETFFPDRKSEFWMPRWEVWDQKAQDHRIWKVTYGLVASSKTNLISDENLDAVQGRLLEALAEIHQFSENHACTNFSKCFENAIFSIETSNRQGFHKDLAPPGLLSEKAMAILDAVQNAWVFGGMGSWNDMGFDGKDGEEYNRVSEALFRCLNESILAAVNSGTKSLGQ